MNKPPKIHPKAEPTLEGWIRPESKELLKKEEHTEEQIEAYNLVISKKEAEEKKILDERERLTHTHEDGTTHIHADGDVEHTHEYINTKKVPDKSIDKMTKKELKEYAWDHDIETMYLNKKQIIEALKEAGLS